MKFVILAVIMVCLFGFFHIMFIIYDNMWYNNTNGLIPTISNNLNSSLSNSTRSRIANQTQMYRDAFGLGRVICLVLVPVCIFIEAVDRPQIQG